MDDDDWKTPYEEVLEDLISDSKDESDDKIEQANKKDPDSLKLIYMPKLKLHFAHSFIPSNQKKAPVSTLIVAESITENLVHGECWDGSYKPIGLSYKTKLDDILYDMVFYHGRIHIMPAKTRSKEIFYLPIAKSNEKMRLYNNNKEMKDSPFSIMGHKNGIGIEPLVMIHKTPSDVFGKAIYYYPYDKEFRTVDLTIKGDLKTIRKAYSHLLS